MLGLETLPERIQNKIMFEPMSGCWLWTAGLDLDGYGHVHIETIDGKEINGGAHKHIYQILIGPVPKGLQLDHRCRVRCCVNPLHLEPVTSRENVLRGNNHNRAKTHCPHGHEYTEANTYKYTQTERYGQINARQCRECYRLRMANRKNNLTEAGKKLRNERRRKLYLEKKQKEII